jgi:hypothetical protein
MDGPMATPPPVNSQLLAFRVLMTVFVTAVMAAGPATRGQAESRAHCVLGLVAFAWEASAADRFYLAYESSGEATFQVGVRSEGDCQESEIGLWVDY